jgi:hypothetical protein
VSREAYPDVFCRFDGYSIAEGATEKSLISGKDGMRGRKRVAACSSLAWVSLPDTPRLAKPVANVLLLLCGILRQDE